MLIFKVVVFQRIVNKNFKPHENVKPESQAGDLRAGKVLDVWWSLVGPFSF